MYHRKMTDSWNQFEVVVTSRHCKRAFLDQPVPRALLEAVLTAAGHAPSTRNGQPWRVSVVSDGARASLVRRLTDELERGRKPAPDYPNRPRTVDPVTEQRARVSVAGVLRALDLDPQGPAGRRAHLRMNLAFYGAPVAMVFHLPAEAGRGAFLEIGFFIQNVMLGLVACGLGSCPQYSVAGYPQVLREELDLAADRLIVCTLAVGYPDPAASVNAYVPARAALPDYTRWHDQAPPSFTEASCRADESRRDAEPASVNTSSHSRERTT
jgi:nitroreductase